MAALDRYTEYLLDGAPLPRGPRLVPGILIPSLPEDTGPLSVRVSIQRVLDNREGELRSPDIETITRVLRERAEDLLAMLKEPEHAVGLVELMLEVRDAHGRLTGQDLRDAELAHIMEHMRTAM